MYHVLLALQCIYGCIDEGSENIEWEEGREWKLAGLLYVDDLVLCGKFGRRLEGNGGMFC